MGQSASGYRNKAIPDQPQQAEMVNILCFLSGVVVEGITFTQSYQVGQVLCVARG
jgi:hypothetical protein